MAESHLRLLFFFFFSILVSFFASSVAQPNFLLDNCPNNNGNYTSNSAFERNLNSILSSISSNTVIDYGFYNESVGQGPDDTVNAIALCRGDVSVDVCRGCLQNATKEILVVCPNQKQSVGWYDECMLRYSNESISGTVDLKPNTGLSNTQNVTDNVNEFNQALQTLFGRLRDTAASGNSLRKFATGDTTVGFQRIFALVQCTPDLDRLECSDCLDNTIKQIPDCCNNKKGGRVLNPSCNFRYEVNDRFFNPTTDSPPPSPSSPTGNDNTARTVVIIVVPIVSVVILVVCIFVFLKMRKRKPKEMIEDVDHISGAESLQFDFSVIRVATDDFSDENKLGQGGFGAVYKGKLSNGQEIAVKRLSKDSGQGDSEFKNEVLLVAKLQHRNLVRLLGFSIEGNERILIYEFVPNRSLDYFIFDPKRRAQLNWEMRFKIIGGIARGMLYLHEDSRLRIIHRDLKTSNILLDAEMNPKIADFGMARLFEVDETQANTNRIVGTYGYMAPEYAMHGQFSVKSDVYSFGVLVLEIVTGQRNNSFRIGEDVGDLLSFAWRNWREGTIANLIDPTLSTGSRKEMIRCIHIGLLCVQEKVIDRPTMASIVLMLNSFSLNLPVPSQPEFSMHSNLLETTSSVGYNTEVTQSDYSKRETLPLYANSEHSAELHPR